MPSGFQYDAAASTAGSVFKAYTDAFLLAAMTGSTELHFRLDYEGCYNGDEPDCFDNAVSSRSHNYGTFWG